MATPEETTRALAQAVGDALREAHCSQRVASELTGIPMTTLVRRLSGRSPFTITELALLADVTDRLPSDLIAAAEALIAAGEVVVALEGATASV